MVWIRFWLSVLSVIISYGGKYNCWVMGSDWLLITFERVLGKCLSELAFLIKNEPKRLGPQLHLDQNTHLVNHNTFVTRSEVRPVRPLVFGLLVHSVGSVWLYKLIKILKNMKHLKRKIWFNCFFFCLVCIGLWVKLFKLFLWINALVDWMVSWID